MLITREGESFSVFQVAPCFLRTTVSSKLFIYSSRIQNLRYGARLVVENACSLQQLPKAKLFFIVNLN
jgi:hypothetical protein